METLAKGRDINDAKIKSEIASQVLPLIEDLPSFERETYRQRLARFLKVDERALTGAQAPAPRIRRPRASRQANIPVSPPAVSLSISSSRRVEEYIIAVLLRKPELLYRLDRFLQQYGLARLSAEDFDYTDYQLLFGLIRAAVEQDQTEHHDFVIESLPESLRGLSAELLAQTEKLDPLEEKLVAELLRGVKRVRDDATNEKIIQYKFLQEDAQENGDLKTATLYQGEVLKLTKLKRVIDELDRKMSLKRLE